MVGVLYDAFCAADPTFYDSPRRIAAEKVSLDGTADFSVSARAVPDGWLREVGDEWVMLSPRAAAIPGQGWKIHVSACLDNADTVLDAVWDYCVERSVPFKYLTGRAALFMRNVKYADRGGSGKFATLYPAGELQLRAVLEELDAVIGGEPGPYVLSDLRWNQGPLYVRYGGFARRFLETPDGGREPAIEAPDGTLVPDRRAPAFTVPEWVEIPEFLRPALAARDTAAFDRTPYAPEQALHFSNGGGVYLARDTRSGDRVVLKEARPHAGLAPDRSDAVARLRRERDILRTLSGLPGVPRCLDYFSVAEHEFLVEEFVDGQPLSTAFKTRNPLIADELTPDRAQEYTVWAVAICDAVEAAIAAIHRRGIVVGDLHPFNILVTDDGTVRLIDFEVSAPAAENRRPSMGNPGFAPREPRRGTAVDDYALACLRLFLFLPLTALLHQDPGKARTLADQIRARFPVPPGFLDHAVATITTTGDRAVSASAGDAAAAVPPDPARRWEQLHGSWPRLRRSLAAAVIASATPGREDRLYPGDIQQFLTPSGGLGIAYGAAGVLYALSASGSPVPADHEEWLLRRTQRLDPGTGAGFCTGTHGIAFALDRLGHRTAAANLLDRSAPPNPRSENLSLFDGLSGIALSLADYAARSGDASAREAATHIAAAVAGRLADPLASPSRPGPIGLMHGASGPALLFIRMFEHTGDTGYLDLAAAALDLDLHASLEPAPGSWALRTPRPRMYLADGIAGIALVLNRYLAHRADDRLTAAVAAIARPLGSGYHSHSGLFTGRAGMIAALARATTPGSAGAVADQTRALGWHALDRDGEIAFPGDYLLRLSTDLATGTAGILLALHSTWHADAAAFPFLEPAAPWNDPLPDDFRADRAPRQHGYPNPRPQERR
ncbi:MULTISPECIES: class III lanthionine synthetase LanKC [Actinomycetes]|uniref:class III lanthionine synthetase LanKC n=1 Tax=Actinomycetes TaxID=1760 RepID=UPI0001B55C24|nr:MULTISPECIES: class III lanthionine synthetase LanKC [Actinomycetes]